MFSIEYLAKLNVKRYTHNKMYTLANFVFKINLVSKKTDLWRFLNAAVNKEQFCKYGNLRFKLCVHKIKINKSNVSPKA